MANNRDEGTPVMIKLSYANYKFKIYLDDIEVFSMIYDGSVDSMEISSRENTEVVYSDITFC